jgi:Tol biopolymer transport system component
MLRYARGPKQFVPYLPGVSADYLDFTRDSQWVAYSDSPDSSLWKRRADGSQAMQLTFPPMNVELPRWSPDGKWIAFMGIKHGDDTWKVYIVPAEGGESQVVMPAASSQGAPTWSPDSKRISFGDLALGSGGFPKSTAIHIVDLTSHESSTLPGSNGLWTARWSPDGRHIAAITTDTKTLKVYDFRASQWQEVASAGSVSDLNWSRKGDALYFVDILPASGPAVYRVRLQDRKVEKVTTLAGSNPIRSAWLGVTPDDSILVSNSVGSSEIYALDVDLP